MSKGAHRKSLGGHLLAKWLYAAGWTQESIGMQLGLNRITAKKYLQNPEKYFTMEHYTGIHYMLPDKTFADVINAVTRSPIAVHTFVEDEFLMSPRQKKTRWMDE